MRPFSSPFATRSNRPVSQSVMRRTLSGAVKFSVTKSIDPQLRNPLFTPFLRARFIAWKFPSNSFLPSSPFVSIIIFRSVIIAPTSFLNRCCGGKNRPLFIDRGFACSRKLGALCVHQDGNQYSAYQFLERFRVTPGTCFSQHLSSSYLPYII